jgi:Ca-activated chloride channel family protein
MRFLALPAGAAMLLLAAAAASVVGLYMLRPSPRRLVISSTLVWRRVLKERKRKPERLRWWLSLLLALAVALSIATALTRPEIAAVSGRAEELVVVVDDSATMGARSPDGRTRLERALDLARATIEAGGAGSRFLVADTMHQISAPTFQDKHVALTRLDRIKPGSGGQPRFPDIIPPHRTGTTGQALFITDGVAGVEAPREVRTISVFQPVDNVGIVAFDVRPVPGNPRHYEAFVEVLNASSGNKRVELRVAGTGAKVITKTVQLAGRSSTNEVLDVSAFDSGPLRATVESDYDGFAPDDIAFAFLPAKHMVRVGLVTRGNAQLQRALELLPRVQITVLSPERASAIRGLDAVVFDRYAPPDSPRLPALLIRPPRTNWLPRQVGEVADIGIARWDRAHPLLRHLNLRDITAESEELLKPNNAGNDAGERVRVLAVGPRDQPMVLAREAGVRWIALAFALEQSSFPQQTSFPIFLSNSVDWLTNESGALSRELGAVSVPLAKAKVVDLEGREVKVQWTHDATLFEAPQPGFFIVSSGDERARVAVNLLDPRTSALNESPLPPQTQDREPARPGARIAIDPWMLLLLMAVGLLTIEWLTYNRRVTI